MNKILIVMTAIAALIGPAVAADLPVKAPRYASPSSPWTGCYAGVNGGYSWNNGHSTYQDPNATPDPINGIPSAPGIYGAIFIPGPSPSEKGWLGGVTAGCNWQRQQWVFGIEADIDAGNSSGSQTTFGPRPNLAEGYYLSSQKVTGNEFWVGSAQEKVSLRWLSTVRGRLGIAVQDHLMLFATGGLAVGRASTEGFVHVTNPGIAYEDWSGSNSATMFGYAVGGGAEWAFSDHWTAKGEYLWYNLGDISHPLNCVSSDTGCGGTSGNYTSLGNTSSSVHGSIVRVGINYKYN